MGALTHPDGPKVQKRRSDRIFICIPLSISGTDQNGQDFGNRAVTQMVARFGASIVTKMFLSPEQELTLKPTAKKAIRARVIGQTSISPEGHVYGIAFLNTTSDSWGIHFPPLPEAVSASTLLECCTCHVCESVRLNELELDVVHASGGLRRICSQCGDLTTWRLAEQTLSRKPPRPLHDPKGHGENEQADSELRSEAPLAAGSAALSPYPQRRMYPRIRVNMKACIAQPGSADDIVTAVNMSRGGILARSARVYAIESWIQLAVPYTPSAANIFVPARIVWRVDIDGVCEYGIKYVRF